MLEHYVEPVCAVTMDDRWFPVLISTWWGETQVTQVDAYYAWMDRQVARAQAEGSKLVLVADARGVTRSSSVSRRHSAQQTDAREETLRERVLGTCVVVRGAFLLGIIAAFVGVLRRGVRVSSFGEPAAALERALVKLDQAGIPRPPGLDPHAYERPPRPEAP